MPESAIPQPKPVPVGNVPNIDARGPVQSLMGLARTYGPIFRLEMIDRELIVVSSQWLVNELCDEKRFDKRVHGPLRHVPRLRQRGSDQLNHEHAGVPNAGRNGLLLRHRGLG